jgi:hypothetical protein
LFKITEPPRRERWNIFNRIRETGSTGKALHEELDQPLLSSPQKIFWFSLSVFQRRQGGRLYFNNSPERLLKH